MKRPMIAIGVIVAMTFATLISITSISATAADGPSITQFRHLQRQVNRLEGRVNQLQGDVRAINQDVNVLWQDVFGCTFPGDPLTTFTDGSQAYVLYYDVFCTAIAGPAKPGLNEIDRQTKGR